MSERIPLGALRENHDPVARDLVTREQLLALIDAVEAAHVFLVDVDDALADDPSGHDAYVRVGARFLNTHERRLRAALDRFEVSA